MFLLKIWQAVSTGLIYGDHAYFKSGWNVMDGTLVIVSLIDTSMVIIFGQTSKIFGILRVFRLVRALRPLRVINRAPGLKLVVQTLLSSLKPIGNIVLICCTFFIIFGILGVQVLFITGIHLAWFLRARVQKFNICTDKLFLNTCSNSANFHSVFNCIIALQGNFFLLRGSWFTHDQKQNSVFGIERERQSMGQSQIQLWQFGPSSDVALCFVLKRWLGFHNVSGPWCCRAWPTGDKALNLKKLKLKYTNFVFYYYRTENKELTCVNFIQLKNVFIEISEFRSSFSFLLL